MCRWWILAFTEQPRGTMPRACSNRGCGKRASHALEGSNNSEVCSQHAKQGMVTCGRKCTHEGCNKRPSYGVQGDKNRNKELFCSQHAKQGMVDVRNPKCAEPCCSKRPYYGVEGNTKRRFCAQHAKQGMVILYSKRRCAQQGGGSGSSTDGSSGSCTRWASFRVEGGGTGEVWCSHHARQGMISISGGKRCADSTCWRYPSYGIEGSNKKEFCAQHAKLGMIDVASKKTCAHEGCSKKKPSFGVEGSNKPRFCTQHALQGMIDVRSRKCANPCCSKRPSYGVKGSKKPELCAHHAKPGMVDVRNKRCGKEGCDKGPSYAVEGSRTREFCAQHAKPGMVNTRKISRRSVNQGCDKSPSYGVEGSKRPPAECFGQAAPQGMVDVRNKKSTSQEGSCSKPPLSRMEGSEARECSVQYAEVVMGRSDDGKSLGIRWGGVQCHRGSSPVTNGAGNGISFAGSKCEDPVVVGGGDSNVIMETVPQGRKSRGGFSRKRARRQGHPADSVSIRTRGSSSSGNGQHCQRPSSGLSLMARPDATIPVLERGGLAVQSTASSVELATSGGGTEPLFSPKSGVTVKVE